MQHIPHDDLAWRAAARGPVDDEVEEHLRTCALCAAELEALEQTVERIRDGALEPAPLPEGLWDRIAAEVAGDATSHDERPAEVVPLPVATEDAPPRARDRRIRRPLARRFSGRALVVACVATAIVVGGGVGLGAWIAQRPPAEQVLASIDLAPLEDGLADASASIVERDGHRVLVIDAASLPSAEGATLDVWLIDADVVGMVNVGILDEDHAEYVLPDDLDLGEFPIVDVSIEPLDGDPTHSGASIWRGSLA
ncbi:anti-sigma factor [Agrococcus sp. SGAir0287]|uniref:anti-sigma factor n=1 Tax=Agrococcus sp. SGAir0287 TaxID=2070347 RepID=UPI0010F53FB1|nr:anti-sigma factor [Agrococcus sp. SGAir0287]